MENFSLLTNSSPRRVFFFFFFITRTYRRTSEIIITVGLFKENDVFATCTMCIYIYVYVRACVAQLRAYTRVFV